MQFLKIKYKIITIIGIFLTISLGFANSFDVMAAHFGVSPMTQKIALVPGQVYYGSLRVINPMDNDRDFEYKVDVEPFGVDEANNVVYTAKEDYNRIVEWITIENDRGVVAPNSSRPVDFSIVVPDDAPAGGQYASIVVSSVNGDEVNDGVGIKQTIRVAHLIYAEVAGETVYDGDIADISVPGFLFSGDISGSATMKNNGNTHVEAESVLQVFPLFSDEEIYTNEEEPQLNMVMPDSVRHINTVWGDTPTIGIFRVLYTVNFDGKTGTVEKMVIVCPVWLLFVIVFCVTLLIIWLVTRVKSRDRVVKKSED